MGIFDIFRGERRAERQVSFDDELLRALLSSEKVTRETALQIPAISSGIELIAGIIASTPIKLYVEKDGKTDEVKNDPRLRLLNDETGDTLNSNEFWRAMIHDYYLGRGGYAYINRSRGRIVSLHYVDSRHITILRSTDHIFKDYDVCVDGVRYAPYNFIRILRNTCDGAEGTPITADNSKIIETAMQTLRLESYFAKKGGNKKGFIKSKKKLDQGAIDRLKEGFAQMYSNDSDNVVVLSDGLDFQETSSTSVEMQLNENKKTNADEFAKLFHVPVDTMEGKTKDMAALAKLAAIPLMTTIQCALNASLLLEKEKGGHYWAFDTKELLKGDIKERYEAYKLALDANFMQVDEVRFAEDLAPLGLNWIKLGLQDVLYDPKTKVIYTPNTNKTGVMNTEAMSMRNAEAE